MKFSTDPNSEFAVVINTVCLVGVLVAAAFFLGMHLGHNQKPEVCKTQTQTDCIWVNGTATWK